MTLTEEFNIEVDKDIGKVRDKVLSFNADLIRAAPVDTGAFKGAWNVKEKSKLSWVIFNRMEYASILWAGRIMGLSSRSNPMMRGSLQWKEGGEPMLAKFRKDLGRAV